MIKQLLRLLKPWQMIVFDDFGSAAREAEKLNRDGYKTRMVCCDGKIIVRYK